MSTQLGTVSRKVLLQPQGRFGIHVNQRFAIIGQSTLPHKKTKQRSCLRPKMLPVLTFWSRDVTAFEDFVLKRSSRHCPVTWAWK